MKRLILVAMLLSICLYSCNEGCEETEAPIKSSAISATIMVVDQNLNPVEFYNTYVDFQKIWCDGAWSATAVNYGATDEKGEYQTYSPLIDLENTEDYITVRYMVGTGADEQVYDERVSYAGFEHNRTTYINHTFVVVQ